MTGKDEKEVIKVAVAALVTELVRGIFGLIFGSQETKTRIHNKYRGGGMYESHNNDSSNAGIHNSSMGFRW